MKTITFAELKRLSFCNSKKLPLAININGERHEWLGIGWIKAGKPTGKEPKVIE